MRHTRLLALLATQLLTHAALAAPPGQPTGQVPGSLISQARVSTGLDYTTSLYKPLSLDPWGVTRTVPTDGAGNNCGSTSPLPCPQPAGSGSGGASNTVAATSPGTSASAANPVQPTTGGLPFNTILQSGTPSACSIATASTPNTVGTSATLVLDTAANVGRNAGAMVLPATATAPVEYQWSNSATGLTTTQGGTTFQVTPGGQIPFAGAPNTQLYAISTSAQVVSCRIDK